MTDPGPSVPPGVVVKTKAPGVVVPIIGVVIGVVTAAIGIVVFFVAGVSGILDSQVHLAPVTVTINCHVGDYYVYQRTGSQQSVPGFSESRFGPATLTPSEVQVTSPGGGPVATWTGNGSETITSGSYLYTDAVGFHADTAGRYTVQIADVTPSAVIVAPSIGSQFASAAPWLGLTGVGGLVAIGSAIWLIVAATRREKLRRQASGPPAAAWGYAYPPGPPGYVSYPVTYQSPYPSPPPGAGPPGPPSAPG